VSILRGPMRDQLFSHRFRANWRLQRAGGLRPPRRRAGTDDPLALIQYLDSRPTWSATSTPRSTAPAWRIRWKCASR
jgi:hypothetical protein